MMLRDNMTSMIQMYQRKNCPLLPDLIFIRENMFSSKLYLHCQNQQTIQIMLTQSTWSQHSIFVSEEKKLIILSAFYFSYCTSLLLSLKQVRADKESRWQRESKKFFIFLLFSSLRVYYFHTDSFPTYGPQIQESKTDSNLRPSDRPQKQRCGWFLFSFLSCNRQKSFYFSDHSF